MPIGHVQFFPLTPKYSKHPFTQHLHCVSIMNNGKWYKRYVGPMHYHNIFYKVLEHLGVLVTAPVRYQGRTLYITPQTTIHVTGRTWIVLLVLHFCDSEYIICSSLTLQKCNQEKLEHKGRSKAYIGVCSYFCMSWWFTFISESHFAPR